MVRKWVSVTGRVVVIFICLSQYKFTFVKNSMLYGDIWSCFSSHHLRHSFPSTSNFSLVPPSSSSSRVSCHPHIFLCRLPTFAPVSYAACAPSHTYNTQTPKRPVQTPSKRPHAAHPYTQVQPFPSTPLATSQIRRTSPSASE